MNYELPHELWSLIVNMIPASSLMLRWTSKTAYSFLPFNLDYSVIFKNLVIEGNIELLTLHKNLLSTSCRSYLPDIATLAVQNGKELVIKWLRQEKLFIPSLLTLTHQTLNSHYPLAIDLLDSKHSFFDYKEKNKLLDVAIATGNYSAFQLLGGLNIHTKLSTTFQRVIDLDHLEFVRLLLKNVKNERHLISLVELRENETSTWIRDHYHPH